MWEVNVMKKLLCFFLIAGIVSACACYRDDVTMQNPKTVETAACRHNYQAPPYVDGNYYRDVKECVENYEKMGWLRVAPQGNVLALEGD